MKRGHLLITLLVATGLFFATFITAGCGGGGGSAFDSGIQSTPTVYGGATATPTNTPLSSTWIEGKTLDENLQELSAKFVLLSTAAGVVIDRKTSNTYGDYKFENQSPQKVWLRLYDIEGGVMIGSKVVTLVTGRNWINLQKGHFEDPNEIINPTPTSTTGPTVTPTGGPTGSPTVTPTNTPGTGTGNVSGKTFDLNPLPNPAPGANIKLTKGSEEVTKTSGSDGSYSFVGLAAGTWHMKASYNGKNIEKDITVSAGYETIMNLYFGAVQGSALKIIK